jgi:hypothetical protein
MFQLRLIERSGKAVLQVTALCLALTWGKMRCKIPSEAEQLAPHSTADDQPIE